MGLFERFTGLLLIVLLFVALVHNKGKDFDFTVRYYHTRDEIFSIDDPDKFNQIESIYKPQYKNVFVAHGFTNVWPKRAWMNVGYSFIFDSKLKQIETTLILDRTLITVWPYRLLTDILIPSFRLQKTWFSKSIKKR